MALSSALPVLSARPFHSDGSGLRCGFGCQIYGSFPSPDTGSSGRLHSRGGRNKRMRRQEDSRLRLSFGLSSLQADDLKTGAALSSSSGLFSRTPGFRRVVGVSPPAAVCLRSGTLTLHTLCCRGGSGVSERVIKSSPGLKMPELQTWGDAEQPPESLQLLHLGT